MRPRTDAWRETPDAVPEFVAVPYRGPSTGSVNAATFQQPLHGGVCAGPPRSVAVVWGQSSSAAAVFQKRFHETPAPRLPHCLPLLGPRGFRLPWRRGPPPLLPPPLFVFAVLLWRRFRVFQGGSSPPPPTPAVRRPAAAAAAALLRPLRFPPRFLLFAPALRYVPDLGD